MKEFEGEGEIWIGFDASAAHVRAAAAYIERFGVCEAQRRVAAAHLRDAWWISVVWIDWARERRRGMMQEQSEKRVCTAAAGGSCKLIDCELHAKKK